MKTAAFYDFEEEPASPGTEDYYAAGIRDDRFGLTFREPPAEIV